MKHIFLFAVLLLTLCACSFENNGGVQLYYVSGNAESLIEAEYSEKSLDGLKDIVNELTNSPRDARLRSVMQNAVCESVELTDGCAYVNFSKEYGELGAPDRTLADACVVLTMTGLDGIDSVWITVEGVGGAPLSHKDIMLTEEVGTPEVITVTVYQLDSINVELIGEKRRIVLREGQTAQRCLFDELKKIGYETNPISILTAKTRLLSSELVNGILTLDMSDDFLTPPLSDTQRLVIQGIARSFTEIEGVNGVKLTVNGEPLREYVGLELPEVLTKDY